MGGFWLTGPTHLITNEKRQTASYLSAGWSANISAEVESRLMSKAEHVLNLHDLPYDLRREAEDEDLDDIWEYDVVPLDQLDAFNARPRRRDYSSSSGSED